MAEHETSTNSTKEHKVFEYDQVDDYIWIGTNQCCKMHFEQKLIDHGIKADISLEEERVDTPFGVDTYLWMPVVDDTPPSQHQFQVGVGHLEDLIREHAKVYVHCMNGHGRAPTLVAAYYIHAKGMSVDAAIAAVGKKRRGTHINDSQRKGIEKFANSLL